MLFNAMPMSLKGRVIHDFTYGLRSRKCPHMGLVNLTPSGQCAHLCAYCYARGYKWSVHPEKTGKVLYYSNVAEKLESELANMTLCPPLYLCATTDVFQPVDEIVESALKVIKAIMRFGVSFHVVTKSNLVRRILQIPGFDNYPYFFLEISVDTSNEDKRRLLSPNASPVKERIETLRLFASKNFYVVMRIDPIIFGYTDDHEEVLDLLRMAKSAGVKHIISSTTRFDAPGLKELQERLKNAGMGNVAERIRDNYVYEDRWLKVPRKRRERFHINLKTEAEKLGMTYAVCMELGSSYDSNSILHCEGSPNSYMMIRTSEGSFKPVCHADCIRSCPDPKEPPCGAPELAFQYPFQTRTLTRRTSSSIQLQLGSAT